MRVIAGKARSLRLKTIEGMDTRPTTDRIKETLFNMIQPSIADSRFLDLFAGSGGIGIEALSRGASCCVFVEQQRKAAECIRENLAFTRLKDSATLLVTDAVSAVRKLNGEEAFSWIFMDPPYGKGLVFSCAAVTTSVYDSLRLFYPYRSGFRPSSENKGDFPFSVRSVHVRILCFSAWALLRLSHGSQTDRRSVCRGKNHEK